jgi:hypothetical protein
MAEEKPVQGRRTQRKLAFARAYADPASPTFNKGTESYRVANPDCANSEAGRKGAANMLKDPIVQAEIEKLARMHAVVAGATDDGLEGYVKRCQTYTEKIMAAGDPKGYNAAAKFMELEGKALGHLIERFKDLTPPKLPTNRDELKTMLRGALAQMDELDRPNPLPQIAGRTVAQEQAEDAEYEIVETKPHE